MNLERLMTIQGRMDDALDRDDMEAVRMLMPIRDALYATLKPGDALTYIEWRREHIDDLRMLFHQGDA